MEITTLTGESSRSIPPFTNKLKPLTKNNAESIESIYSLAKFPGDILITILTGEA
jgi:hypothetical protein